MDSEDVLESKCENIMNIVVESRKQLQKLYNVYTEKMSVVDSKLLNLELQTLCYYRYKSKNAVPSVDEGAGEDYDDFLDEITANHWRIEDTMRKLVKTREIMEQLEADVIGRRLRAPLTADTMLAQAKAKNDKIPM